MCEVLEGDVEVRVLLVQQAYEAVEGVQDLTPATTDASFSDSTGAPSAWRPRSARLYSRSAYSSVISTPPTSNGSSDFSVWRRPRRRVVAAYSAMSRCRWLAIRSGPCGSVVGGCLLAASIPKPSTTLSPGLTAREPPIHRVRIRLDPFAGGREHEPVTTYSAVRTTGIYCRPGCGARPLAENVRTFELAAAAEAAGYRACLRCRPYRVAGAVGDDVPELVCRAVQLIISGVLDDANEAAVGARLGVSARHLRRMFNDHLGVTPDQFARSRRAHFARRLLDDCDLTIAEVAFASGFGSLRQFNRAMQEVFRSAPRELRERRRRDDRLTADGGLVLRMPFTAPYDWDVTIDFLAERAIPGVESVESGVYRRTIALDGAPGMLEIGPGSTGHLLLRAHLPYWEGVIHVVERAARLVGIDSDPALASAQLAADATLGPLITSRPGVRVRAHGDRSRLPFTRSSAKNSAARMQGAALVAWPAPTGHPSPGLRTGSHTPSRPPKPSRPCSRTSTAYPVGSARPSAPWREQWCPGRSRSTAASRWRSS